MPKKNTNAAAGGRPTDGLSLDNMPSVFPQGRRALEDYRIGAAWPGSPWTTAMRVEISTEAGGRPHLVVAVEAERVPLALVTDASPRIGFCLKRSAIWFLVLGGGAMTMTPMSTMLAGTQWSSEARLLLGRREPGLLLVATYGGTIERLTSVTAHPRWWEGLRNWIGLLPACTLERFIEHTRADGAFMGAMGCVGSPVRFADDGNLDLF